jgi:hypothetical protein
MFWRLSPNREEKDVDRSTAAWVTFVAEEAPKERNVHASALLGIIGKSREYIDCDITVQLLSTPQIP